MISMLVLLA